MSAPAKKPRASCVLLALVISVALALLACVIFCGYIVIHEEVIEPKRRAADPEYARRKDAERAAAEAARAKRAEQAKQAEQAKAPQAAQDEHATLERALEAARAKGHTPKLSLKPPKPLKADPNLKQTPQGLLVREDTYDHLGLSYDIIKSTPLKDFTLITELEDISPGLDDDAMEIIVSFAQGLASASMTYDELRSRRGQRTQGYLLSRPDRPKLGPIHLDSPEPSRRILRVEVIAGKVRVWVNGHEQFLEKARSSSTSSAFAKWRADAFEAPSPVELQVRFHPKGKENPFKRVASVTIASVYLCAP